jgi:hypothetical protein
MALPATPLDPLRTANPPPSLSQTLNDTIAAANTRAKDGQAIYGPIATLWDEYLQSEAVRRLPARLRKPLQHLCKDIATLANSHFDAYIKGSIPTRTKPLTTPAPADLLPPRAALPTRQPQKPSTYAEAAATLPAEPQRAPQAYKQKASSKKPLPDTRLFIRVGPNHSARSAGAFAIQTALKKNLQSNAALIKEVIEVKSGFAIRTESPSALADLEHFSDAISNLITDCKVERQPAWTSYLLDFIPRTVRILDNAGQINNTPVTADILSEAVRDYTGKQSVKATETRKSLEEGLFSTAWVVSFGTEGHQPLPQSLRILGTTVRVHLLKNRTRVLQCTKCYNWHNPRTCNRPQRCRLCGSTQHLEENHSTQCGTAKPHNCPYRCCHCGGAHSADDRKCQLRPVASKAITKPQKIAIQQLSKAERTRACAAAGCTKAVVTAPTALATPPLRPTYGPPATATAQRFFTVPPVSLHSPHFDE